MKILVCFKQVPDMESKFKVDGAWYAQTDLAWRMNEYDEYGVEQAVRLKEQVKDADITVLCIGSDQVKETMKKALAMGCDRGAHIADDDAPRREAYQIAGIIAEFSKGKGFDLEDFRIQLQQMQNMGGIGSLMDKMPGMGNMAAAAQNVDEKQFKRMEAIISSMTMK